MGASNGNDETTNVTPATSDDSKTEEPEQEEKKEEAKVKSPEKEREVEQSVEESLTPPLLPSMIIVQVQNIQECQNEKKQEKEKDSKVKRNQWDMFAEQDIFKADTEVRKNFVLVSV